MGTGRKWLVGCGTGCAVVLVLGAILLGGTVKVVVDAVHKFQAADTTQETLVSVFGPIESYTPPWDGHLDPQRIEAFLAVREKTQAERQELDRIIGEVLPALNDEKSARKVLRGLRAGAELTSHLATFVRDRGSAMVDQSMGEGEYIYLYCLSYYVLLEEDPGSGPPNFKVSEKGGGFSWDARDRNWETPEARRREISTRVNAWMRPMLANQLAAIPDTSATDVDTWRQKLQAELQAMQDDRTWIAWQDGLPDATRESLAPYRDRLAAQWSPMANMLDLLLFEPDEDHRGAHRHRRDRGDV